MSGRTAWLAGLGFLLALAGCHAPPTPPAAPLVARFYLEARPAEAAISVRLPVSGVTVAVSPKPVLVEYDLAGVDVAQVELGRCLLFRLTPAAARDLYRLTGSAQGRRLVLLLNDQPAGARRLDQPVSDGALAIFVEMPDNELPTLAEKIRRTSAALAEAARR